MSGANDVTSERGAEGRVVGDPSTTDGDDRATIRTIDDGHPRALIPQLREPRDIDAIERRRAHLWVVAAIIMLAASLAVALLFLTERVDHLVWDVPTLGWGFLGLTVAFLLYVVDQERRLRDLTGSLIEERVLTSALRARIIDLAALTKVGRAVNSVLTLEEVLESIVRAVFELTGASSGSVMLQDGGALVVAASRGDPPAPTGTRIEAGTGVAGWVADRREPVLITGRLSPDQFPGHVENLGAGSSIVAPLIVGDAVLGVLAVERTSDVRAFAESELRSVAVFAEQAATAVHNAQRYDAERETVERLVDVVEQRAEFVATLVHELKTPITVILGFTSLLDNRWGDLPPDRRLEILTSLRAQGERLRAMVDEVLRTSAVEAGAELQRNRIDLGDLLTELVERIGTLAAEREGRERLIRIIGAGPDATVLGDRDALAHAFENLLENAVKYSTPGSPVEVVLRPMDETVQVDIVDHGQGIAEDELESIFDRFRRTDAKVVGGVGLGLYIVRTLVQSHGGRVWAESELGEGTTFSVLLPREDRLLDERGATATSATVSGGEASLR